MAAKAAKFKQEGNDLFKAGLFAGACDRYFKAEKADPRDPVYPSNLSAALFETGDYAACAEAVLRAWKLLKAKSDAKHDLIVRLSSRLAKALCYGARAGSITVSDVSTHEAAIEELRKASITGKPSTSTSAPTDDALVRVWDEWAAIRSEMVAYAQKGDACLGGLSRLPMFSKALYVPFGTDDVIDLTAGWGPGQDHPLKIDKLSVDMLSKLAFMFGGVGDGRHVLGTLCGLLDGYWKLSKAKQLQFKAHLTLLDIHDATLARDLCLFMLLHELATTKDATAKVEIKATLMYMFCGAAMPPYCYERLQALFADLRRRLTSTPTDLPGPIHVVSDSIPAILRIIDYWSKAPKTVRKMLANHESMSLWDRSGMAGPQSIPGVSAEFQRTIDDRVAAQREQIRNSILTMSDADLAKSKLLPAGTSVRSGRAMIEQNIDLLVDEMQKLIMPGAKTQTREATWYKMLKVFVPPKELLARHPSFEVAWKQVKEKGEMATMSKHKAWAHIESEWKPNITIFDPSHDDPHYFPNGDGYPDVSVDMFQIINQFHKFNIRDKRKMAFLDDNQTAWDVCSEFFDNVAAALKTLGNRVTLEFICGGLSEELAKMRFKGDVARPKEFPRKYTRMWLSNVPDYTHGPMNMILYEIPNLQDDPLAAVSCNVLLNTGAWSGDEEYMHTYTLLESRDIPRYLACRVITCRPVMEVLVLGTKPLPRPLTELATRDELTTWLTRVLFNTFIPGKSKPNPNNVRLPHNLVAFFGLLMYLHRAGYPGHWLAEFLTRVLSGRMVSDIAPYTGWYPIPVSERTRRVPSRAVRTDPWLVEFEMILATAYHALPFPVLLPADFSHDPDDMVVYEARVAPVQQFTTLPMLNENPYEPRTHLLFFRADLVSAAGAIRNLPSLFEGSASPAPGTLFIMTAQEHVQYQECIRFRLSRRRVERMKKESARWSMVAFRSGTGVLATQPVTIGKWVLKVDEAKEVEYQQILEELD
ncbi:hypothetical protein K466DRAFT_527460 [Polyporus arcularius HHB13444]|uniref:DUF4470 domain-containing protein n=1 Tax=Polyporus arcularius HHB13444 TaxID=1314778 RepID=A0A5C3P3X7_9APHY|nr:hypothetical protein K466DRAFT_527460 [Polyporus arcularius HHB13444]